MFFLIPQATLQTLQLVTYQVSGHKKKYDGNEKEI